MDILLDIVHSVDYGVLAYISEHWRGGLSDTQEAVAALMVLGYTQAEALHAMEGLDAAGMEADEIIRQCLKKLVKS